MLQLYYIKEFSDVPDGVGTSARGGRAIIRISPLNIINSRQTLACDPKKSGRRYSIARTGEVSNEV